MKFQLGLFDDPFVDDDLAAEIVGSRGRSVAAGRRAQAESMVLLHNTKSTACRRCRWPRGAGGLRRGHCPAEEAARLGEVVTDPADADVAVVRLPAPFDPRDDLFLEAFFHQGPSTTGPGWWPGSRHRRRHAAGDRRQPGTSGDPHPVHRLGHRDPRRRRLLARRAGRRAHRGRPALAGCRSRSPARSRPSVPAPDVADDTVDPLFPAGTASGTGTLRQLAINASTSDDPNRGAGSSAAEGNVPQP